MRSRGRTEAVSSRWLVEDALDDGREAAMKKIGIAVKKSRVVREAPAGSMRYWLGLGSNVGDSAANLTEAVRRLRAEGIRVIRCSPLYRTEPVGIKEQAWFLNQALEIATGLGPSALLRKAKKIEKAMGRTPGLRNGPRPIDIDILLAADAVVRSSSLEIPHPRLAERRFALVPLVRIAPDRIHPILKKRVRTLLRICPDTSKVVRTRLSASKRKYPERD